MAVSVADEGIASSRALVVDASKEMMATHHDDDDLLGAVASISNVRCSQVPSTLHRSWQVHEPFHQHEIAQKVWHSVCESQGGEHIAGAMWQNFV